jgi:hypothetical protein
VNVSVQEIHNEVTILTKEWSRMCLHGLHKLTNDENRIALANRLISLGAEVEKQNEQRDQKEEGKEIERKQQKVKQPIPIPSKHKRSLRTRGSQHVDRPFLKSALSSDMNIEFIVGGGYLQYDRDIGITTGQ